MRRSDPAARGCRFRPRTTTRPATAVATRTLPATILPARDPAGRGPGSTTRRDRPPAPTGPAAASAPAAPGPAVPATPPATTPARRSGFGPSSSRVAGRSPPAATPSARRSPAARDRRPPTPSTTPRLPPAPAAADRATGPVPWRQTSPPAGCGSRPVPASRSPPGNRPGRASAPTASTAPQSPRQIPGRLPVPWPGGRFRRRARA